MSGDPPAAPNLQPKPRRVWWIIGGLVAIGILLQVTGIADNEDSASPDRSSRIEAFTMCRLDVEDKLRAPATADWPAPSQADITQTGRQWTVDTYVDAENAFGAQVRTDVACDLEYEGGGEWLVRSTLD